MNNQVVCFALYLLRFFKACAVLKKKDGEAYENYASPIPSSLHRLSLAGRSPPESASVLPDVHEFMFKSVSSNLRCPG